MKRIAFLILALLLTFGIGLAQAEQIRCAWDANSEPDLAGYRVFVRAEGAAYDYGSPAWEGTATETDPIDVTTWADGAYYFVCRAFDTAGNESGDSNEASYTVDHTAPAPPTGCDVVRIP